MKKIPLYCSTGTFLGRINNRNWHLIPVYGPQLDCDGLELLFFSDWIGEEKQLIEGLLATGLNFPTLHATKGIGDLISSGEVEEGIRRYDISARVAKEIGAKLTVLHLWGPPVSDREFERNFTACGRILEIAEKYGLTLAVENIPCLQRDPMSRLGELAAAYPGVRFTLDTRMAAFHRQFEDLCRGDYDDIAAKAAHFHYSDFLGGYMEFAQLPKILHPGEGLAYPADFAALLRRLDYRGGVTMESPAITPEGGDVEKLNRSLAILRKALG